jgi:hypothetical protein
VTPGLISSVVLHVTEDLSGGCAAPVRIDEVVTSAPSSPEGRRYRVLLLATPDTRVDIKGLAGLQVGIESSGEIQVTNWQLCSTLQFAMEGWPASGTANTMTWERFGSCQYRDLVPFGSFDVTAFGPGVLAGAAHPGTGRAAAADCGMAQLDIPILPERVGWISFGGGARRLSTTGCNPALRACTENIVPVVGTTWSRIKAGFWRER